METNDNFTLSDLVRCPLAADVDRGIDPHHGDISDVPSNITRAEWVLEALRTFQRNHRSGDNAQEIISDFLADLMHLCRMNGIDFDLMRRRAEMHHDEEEESVV